MDIEKVESSLFRKHSKSEFEALALAIFNYQYHNNKVYNEYCKLIGRTVQNVKTLDSIPFLPIEFFKTHKITATTEIEDTVFLSSGTSGMTRSKHFVKDVSLYRNSFLQAFELFYGDIKDYTVLALLPGYLERNGSSLIFMVQELINKSEQEESGFFLHNHEELYNLLIYLKRVKRKVLLIGVSHALLDFADEYEYRLNFNQTIVMETGGMKGRRKELLRVELHSILCKSFGVKHIHSEYGMTELLSQAYSTGDMYFTTPPWMKVKIRDTYDPFSYLSYGITGGINVIDLANLYSCSFIETKDLGKMLESNKFEVLGRFDNSDIRGCNLMIE
ncbi:MAG: acyltransferase [Bacteroidales bacterium]|nr:acyltransferase [Bacteroidales bacterium]